MGQLYSEVKNNSTPLFIKDIPVSDYNVFYARIAELLNSEDKSLPRILLP